MKKRSKSNIACTFLSLIFCCVFYSCSTLQPIYNDAKNTVKQWIEEARINKYEKDKDSANWDISRLDTAVSSTYLSLLERNIILELNKVRSDPSKYAELYIKPMFARFSGLEYGSGQVRILTKEGSKAVAECINALKAATPIGVLTPDEGLYSLAARQVELQGPTGQTGHSSPAGLDLAGRIHELGISTGCYGENIDYGNNEAREIIIALLVDDGVSSRGHRANIMRQNYKSVGVAFGAHKVYGYMCVMDFSGGKY